MARPFGAGENAVNARRSVTATLQTYIWRNSTSATPFCGAVAELAIAAVSKTAVLTAHGGSKPSRSEILEGWQNWQMRTVGSREGR